MLGIVLLSVVQAIKATVYSLSIIYKVYFPQVENVSCGPFY